MQSDCLHSLVSRDRGNGFEHGQGDSGEAEVVLDGVSERQEAKRKHGVRDKRHEPHC